MKLKQIAAAATAAMMIGSCAMAAVPDIYYGTYGLEKGGRVIRIDIPADMYWKVNDESKLQAMAGAELTENDTRKTVTFTAVEGAEGFAQITMGADPDAEKNVLVSGWIIHEDGSIEDNGAFIQTDPETEEAIAISEDGKTLTVTLRGNPTTGYEWTYRPTNGGTIELVSEDYAMDESPEDMTGVGGTYTYVFRAADEPLNAGEDICFEYSCAWEETSIYTFTVGTAVSPSGTLTPAYTEYFFNPVNGGADS